MEDVRLTHLQEQHLAGLRLGDVVSFYMENAPSKVHGRAV